MITINTGNLAWELKFQYDNNIIEKIKSLPKDDRQYNAASKTWFVLKTEQNYKFLNNQLPVQWDTQKQDFYKSNRIILSKNDLIIIKFPYDPNIIAWIKTFQEYKFIPDQAFWILPHVKETVEKIKANNKFNFDLSKLEDVKEKIIEKKEEITIEVPNARPFQLAGIQYLIEKKKSLLADEMGLGKTFQSLNAIKIVNAFPCLIICPASLKYNWANEIKKWMPEKTFQILNGKVTYENVDFTILNYDILKKHKDYLFSLKAKGAILDESHYVKNKKAQRTKLTKELVENIEYQYLLTGTPISNRPSELVTQLNIMKKLNAIGGFNYFINRYCGAKHTRFGLDTSGATNLEELHQKLKAIGMLRRTKAEVLKDLPAKQIINLPIQIDNFADYEKIETDFINFLHEKFSDNPDKIKAALRAETLVQLEHLKKAAALGKMSAAVEWIDNFLETADQKLVIFATHKDIINGIYEKYKDISVTLTGDTPNKQRQDNVDKFQNDKETRLFISSLAAGGVGITLTAASTVLFLELGWTPSAHLQAEDRCHRIGQQESVNCYYLLGMNTVDMKIFELLSHKKIIFQKIVDGKDITEDTLNIFDDIMTKYREKII